MGRRELKFIQNFGFVFGFVLGIPVAALTYFVPFWWLLPILGVFVGYVTNWTALVDDLRASRTRRYGPIRFPGAVRASPARGGRVYARIVADEIVTVANFGNELLHGPQSDAPAP